MKHATFELTIPEALELDQAFQLQQGQRCSLVLKNDAAEGCEVDLYRSKTYMGTWRLEGSSSILITEEVLSLGALTFQKPETMDIRIRPDGNPEPHAESKESVLGFRILVATATGRMVHASSKAPVGARIGAKVLDLCFYSIPAAFVSRSAGGEGTAMALVAIAILVNLFLVVRQGQTVGKWVCKIRLAKHDGDGKPSWVQSVLLRSFLPGAVLAIPGVGIVFALSDLISLGRKDQRCLHDLMAGTRVLRV